LRAWRSVLTRPDFSRRLWAKLENSMSLFIPVRESDNLQWRCLLFCTLMALEPVLMCARIVHSHPPLIWSSCQLHSKEKQSLRLRLNLRILSSSSDSMLWVMSASAIAWVHSSSGEPVILMLSGRPGRALFLV
jgi:hypothetical protein